MSTEGKRMSEGREHEVRRLSRLAPHGIVLALRDALTELDATRSERDALREALKELRLCQVGATQPCWDCIGKADRALKEPA